MNQLKASSFQRRRQLCFPNRERLVPPHAHFPRVSPKMSGTRLSAEASEFVPFAVKLNDNSNNSNNVGRENGVDNNGDADGDAAGSGSGVDENPASSPSSSKSSSATSSCASTTTALTADSAAFEPDYVKKAEKFRMAGVSLQKSVGTSPPPAPYVSVGSSSPAMAMIPPAIAAAYPTTCLASAAPCVPMNVAPPHQLSHVATSPMAMVAARLCGFPMATPNPIAIRPPPIMAPVVPPPSAIAPVVPPISAIPPVVLPPPLVPVLSSKAPPAQVAPSNVSSERPKEIPTSNGDSVKEEIDRWQSTSNSLLAKFEGLQKENENLKTELTQQKDHTAKQALRVAKERSKYADLMEGFSSTTADVARRRIENHNLAKDNDRLKKDNVRLTTVNEELKMALADLNAEIQTMRRGYDALKAEKDEVDGMVGDLEKRFDGLLRMKNHWKKRMNILEDILLE